MAVYKVPQDVEAEDKLIGPFSFRQFIYLLITALAIAAAWFLFKIFAPLGVIPLPVIVFFGALALPLRKDQPMEVYLAAILSFYLKPHRRLWEPDGIDSLIEVTSPKLIEQQLTKDLSMSEAEKRLSYLAEIVDSRGWAVRIPNYNNSSLNNDVYMEAQTTTDVLDSDNNTFRNIDDKITESNDKHRQNIIDMMKNKAISQPVINSESKLVQSHEEIKPTPVINNIQPQPQIEKKVENIPTIQPITTSIKPVSADIMNLATSSDLTVETIAKQANRINSKKELEDEVIISLR